MVDHEVAALEAEFNGQGRPTPEQAAERRFRADALLADAADSASVVRG
jgi:hypothetical protein